MGDLLETYSIRRIRVEMAHGMGVAMLLLGRVMSGLTGSRARRVCRGRVHD
jgi:hypothetical protein